MPARASGILSVSLNFNSIVGLKLLVLIYRPKSKYNFQKYFFQICLGGLRLCLLLQIAINNLGFDFGVINCLFKIN